VETISQAKRCASTPSPMSKDFLGCFVWLSATEIAALRALGSDSPAALWAMIDASPESFIGMLGEVRTTRFRDELWQLIPVEERKVLQDHSFTVPPVGVVIEDTRGSLQEPNYDIDKRNRLHSELQSLRRRHDPDARRRAQQLERELRLLLQGNSYNRSKVSR
jgi:hypothetical protein